MSIKRLKIAIQKSGRLAEVSLNLLQKCGINLEKSKDQLLCRADNFPLDVLLVRDDDIPAFISKDVCQLGIVGKNILAESEFLLGKESYTKLSKLLNLGFGKCRLSLAIPSEENFKGIGYFNGKTIARQKISRKPIKTVMSRSDSLYVIDEAFNLFSIKI